MKRHNPPGVVARAMEEIDRVLKANPGMSIRDMSAAIGRNKDFLYDLRLKPDKYILSIADVDQLNAIYGIDDIYIYKGIPFRSVHAQFERTQAKIGAIRTLLNSI